jgi:hypothetical protein
MSVEAYDKRFARYELYSLLEEGLEAERKGEYRDFDDFMSEFLEEIKAK